MQKIDNSKYILFDFDGTINDSSKLAHLTANGIMDVVKKPHLSEEEFEEFRSKDLRHAIADMKVPFYKVPIILRKVQRAFADNLELIGIIEGLADLLRLMKSRGYKLGIITSNSSENVHALLDREGLTELFDYIRAEKSLFGKSKSMRRFMRKHKISHEQAIYVGDEIRDISAAREAGLKVISVAWGLNSVEGLQKASPDYLVESVSEFKKIFDLAE